MTGETSLLGRTPAELAAQMEEIGEPAYRGRQLFRWLVGRQVESFAEMTDFPLRLREQLAATWPLRQLELRVKQEDRRDGTMKALFRLADGETIETVLMRQAYGNSLCVSTQVGCQIGCRFCASTLGGLVRNLTAGEMLEQAVWMQQLLGEERLSHVVLMGIGEPLENYGPTLRFIRLLHEPDGFGIGYRHITLSTSGIVPRLYELADEKLPITLAVSLHAPNNELRSSIMPVNRKYPLDDLLTACRYFSEQTGRRISFEYALIDGVNDGIELAQQLARLAISQQAHVNLIPLNPSGRGLSGSPKHVVARFRDVLAQQGVNATVRKELGAEIDAACGQLRRRTKEIQT